MRIAAGSVPVRVEGAEIVSEIAMREEESVPNWEVRDDGKHVRVPPPGIQGTVREGMKKIGLRAFVCARCLLAVEKMGSNCVDDGLPAKAQGNVVEAHQELAWADRRWER